MADKVLGVDGALHFNGRIPRFYDVASTGQVSSHLGLGRPRLPSRFVAIDSERRSSVRRRRSVFRLRRAQARRRRAVDVGGPVEEAMKKKTLHNNALPTIVQWAFRNKPNCDTIDYFFKDGCELKN